MNRKEKILIMGACGQIGTELTAALQLTYGVNNVIASDIKYSDKLPEGKIGRAHV